VRKVAEEVKKSCEVCQNTEPPNWQVAQRIDMTPVLPRIFETVCLDVFSLPTVEWQGEIFDVLLLCVDRLSLWMVAKPTQKLGLTSEKAAHLMMDDGWNIFGIPSVITSDQGSQFSGAWWKTMCRRLSIRQAYSQAHRPQANGRAEVAGRQLITTLRKLNAEREVNWVEALPHALRLIHDIAGPTGWSPYQVVFGRERHLGGLPRKSYVEAEDASSFFERKEELENVVAKIINEEHEKEKEKVNQHRKVGHEYRVGDKV